MNAAVLFVGCCSCTGSKFIVVVVVVVVVVDILPATLI
jgi:hypothetical protein